VLLIDCVSESSKGSPRSSSSERNEEGRSFSSRSRELLRGHEGKAHEAPYDDEAGDGEMSIAEVEERVELNEL